MPAMIVGTYTRETSKSKARNGLFISRSDSIQIETRRRITNAYTHVFVSSVSGAEVFSLRSITCLFALAFK
jgi:hypothetical protein